jgi:hypothetical protein
MDPNANLAEMLELAASIIAAGNEDAAIDPSDAARLADLVEALDRWIVGGGFLPKRWAR